MKRIINRNKPAIYILAILALTSCGYNANKVPFPVDSGQRVQSWPLVSTVKKIDWASIKAFPMKPKVEPFDLNKLPATVYDSSIIKPLPFPVEQKRFDYESLPEKDLNIDKLPSQPLKLKNILLDSPQVTRVEMTSLKKGADGMYRFGESQGLRGGVTAIFTDHYGFLWLATTKGLYRYDGESLTLYYKQPGFISQIVEDKQGRIWFRDSDKGMCILNYRQGILSLFAKKPGTQFGLIAKDNNNRIWVEENNGINIIDPENKKLILLDTTILTAANRVWAMKTDNDQNMWITTRGAGVYIVDIKDKKLKHLTTEQGLRSDSLTWLVRDGRGRMWGVCRVLGNDRVVIWDKQQRTVKDIGLVNDHKTVIRAINEGPDGNMWVAVTDRLRNINGGKGIRIINPEKGLIRNLPCYQAYPGDWGSYVQHIGRDSRGQMWLATAEGLNIFNETVKHIGNYGVNDMVEDTAGLIWEMGDVDGVHIFDRKTGLSRYLDRKRGLTSDSVWSSAVRNGNVFLGTSQGLDMIAADKKTMTHFNRGTGLSRKGISGAVVDKAGKIWISGEKHGIDIYDPASNSVKHLGKAQGLCSDTILDMQPDSRHNIWMTYADKSSLNIVDADGGSIRRVDHIFGSQTNNYAVLVPVDQGNVCVFDDNNISLIDLKNKKIASAVRPGSMGTFSSPLYYKGAIYAGTNTGITVIKPTHSTAGDYWKTSTFGSVYDIKKIDLSHSNSSLITHDGYIWWGDLGITVIGIPQKRYVPPVFITGLAINDVEKQFTAGRDNYPGDDDTLYTSKKSVFYTRSNFAAAGPAGMGATDIKGPYNMPVNLELPHRQNYLKFHFLAVDFAKRDFTRYRYLLEGVDQKWSEPATSTVSGNYNDLSPGRYTFKVAATASDGTWTNPVAFTFTILPPWWQTWWAWLAYLFIFAAAIWSFIAYRSRQLTKENRILEHKVHLRTEEVLQQKEEIQAQRDNLETTLEDLKHTQNQLIQSEKMASLGELTAGIAHEIQNPLNFINNFADVNREMIDEMQQELRSGNMDEAMAIADDLKQNEEKISHHGKRADGIVKGMLEHSRASTGQKEPADLNKLADEYLRLAYHGLRAKDKSFNAELITNFDKHLPKANIVSQDLGRVLLNLFNNAFYAVGQKKKIAGGDYKAEVSVNTTASNGQVVIRVKDNGTGIPDKIRDKIMQPFFTTKPTGEGTGLGLSLSYDIVIKGHGGSIKVESSEGEGTEMIVSLPA